MELAFAHGEESLENVSGGSWDWALSFINTLGDYTSGGMATGAMGGALVGSMSPGVGTLIGGSVGGVIGGGVGLVVGVCAYISGERR